MHDELIYKLMCDLMEALNRKGNQTTEYEHKVALAIQDAIIFRRFEVANAR